MPPRHRRPAQRDNGLEQLFAILPWWGPLVALVAIDGAIVAVGNASHWIAATTKLWLMGATLLIGLTGVGGWVEKVRHRHLLATTHKLEHLKALTPDQFEEIVLAAYRTHGYTGSLTGRGADGGVDVILERKGERTYVQCKRWRTATIKVDVVRALKGSMATEGVRKGIMVCCGRFTAEAERFGADSGITCVGGEALLKLISGVQTNDDAAPDASVTLRGVEPSQPIVPAPLAASVGAVSPPCPKCDQPMVHRTSKRGPFWGCAGFPKCRGTRPIAA